MDQSPFPPGAPEPQDAEQARYLVESRPEIAALLRAMQRKGTLVTAFFHGGSDFILTSVAHVEPALGHVVIDQGADAAANARAASSSHVIFVAHHDKIKVQFSAAVLRPIRFAGRDAFLLPFPESLLRLQRREYYRLLVPVTRPVKCVIPATGKAGEETVELTILDISCGGVAVIERGAGPGLEVGTLLQGCCIALPGVGAVVTDLVVRSSLEVTLRNGVSRRRAGCEFVGIREGDRNLVQRYIHHVERQSKARLSGLG